MVENSSSLKTEEGLTSCLHLCSGTTEIRGCSMSGPAAGSHCYRVKPERIRCKVLWKVMEYN